MVQGVNGAEVWFFRVAMALLVLGIAWMVSTTIQIDKATAVMQTQMANHITAHAGCPQGKP